jgi:glycosyltransferase involved in cell wall biosynthesis
VSPKKINRILICVMSPDFNLVNRYSAVSSVIFSIADMLKKGGYEVQVNELSLDEWIKSDKSSITEYAPITRFSMIRYVPKRVRELVKDLLNARKMKELERRLDGLSKSDLIISWITIGSSYAVDLARKWQVPLLSIYDNPLVEEYTYLKGFKPFFSKMINKHEKRTVERSDAVIVYSKAVEEHIIKKHRVKPKFYYNAFTDFKRMHFNDNQKNFSPVNFAYIGSFFNWHRIDDLVEAFINVNKQFTESKLFLVGEGPEFKRLNDGVKHERIIFTGKLDGKPLTELMQKIHVGIISNALWFQAPVKLFQYSAASLAVITKGTPTIKELTRGNPCYLFFKSKEDLEHKMLNLLKSPQQIEIRGKEARDFIRENYSESNYLQFFNEIFRNL